MLAQSLRARGSDPDAPGLTFDRLRGGKGTADQHGEAVDKLQGRDPMLGLDEPPCRAV
jgi:hypothetical protein